MYCKIDNCYNFADNSLGLCYEHLNFIIVPLKYIEQSTINPEELFYPYDNLIDWALSRHT